MSSNTLCRLVMVFGIGIALLSNPARAQANNLPPGPLVIIGGALRANTHEIWSRVVALAGGPGARIAVFPAAAAEPEKAGAKTAQLLRSHGADAFVVPLAPALKNSDYRSLARDRTWVEKIAGASGIFFTGGEQARITQALLDGQGQATPMLDAIRALHARGGVIAGTSAGAAMMSETMFSEPRSTLQMLRTGLRKGKDIAPGLGFVPRGLFVDQHFVVRGRFARLIAAMLKTGDSLGLGVDEDAAAVLQNGEIEIIGNSGAVLIDLTQVEPPFRVEPLGVRNARLSYLDSGDRYLLAKRKAISAKSARGELVQARRSASKEESAEAANYADVLGRSVLPRLLAQVAETSAAEVLGLAFDLGSADKPQTGFEFRFGHLAETTAYRAGEYSAEIYSVFGVRLDIRPVLMSAPLYRVLEQEGSP